MIKNVLLVILVCSSFVFSQEKKVFSLSEAIDFALKNNRKVKGSIYDIDAAKKQKWEAIASGLPQINAKIDYQNNIKRQFDALDFNADGIVDFGAKQTVNASVTLSQKIFDGTYLVGLQSAKVFLEISKNAKQKTDLEIKKAVANAYANVLFADENIDILNKNIIVLDKNIHDMTEIFKNGLGEEESVEQLQITMSSLKSNLNNTVRLKNIAIQMLNITMGLDVDKTILLKDSFDDLMQKYLNYNISQNQNIKNTIDYKIAKNQKKAKKLLLKLEKSKALPSLNAYISGSYLGKNEDFEFLKREQHWQGIVIFGASMNIPIFSSGMRNASTQRAKINLRKAENDLTQTEQSLILKIKSAKSNYKFSLEEYKTKKQNLKLAERIENKNRIKFFEGISSSFDFSQAQTQLYKAQQDLLQSMLSVINKKEELSSIVGSFAQVK